MQIIHRKPKADDRFSEQIHPLLRRVYLAREVGEEAQLNRQLNCLPPPSSLCGVASAVARLIVALRAQQRLIVVGDFDADGATSSALMMLALRAMGFRDIDFLVPNRFEYGYGLTPEIVDLAAQQSPQLLVTVDNGISSLAGVAHANSLGIDVVITDHHLPGAELPAAVAIVNPNQPDCGFPSKNLAGVGVAFYLLSALRAELRNQNWFIEQGIAEPNMATWLDLVALGTVADVVPLDQVNRALVQQGIMRIRAGECRPGILALLRIAGRDSRNLVAADMGFAIGPRLNAAGRLDDMSLGIQCLLTDSPDLALDCARQLDELNQDRKAIEQEMQREALQIVERLPLDAGNMPAALCLFQPDWHQGVVGLLASRIKDKYHRPVIAFARADNGEVKGSARSIKALHIRDALDTVAAHNPGLVSKFGGHAMAAGLSLDESRLEDFIQAFQREVASQLDEDDLRAQLLSDGQLELEHFTMETARQLRDGGPWGQHFPEPLFDGEFLLLDQRIVGERHLKLKLAPVGQPQRVIEAIQFNIDTALWPNRSVRQVRCAYRLDINEFRGVQTLQLMIDYMEAL